MATIDAGWQRNWWLVRVPFLLAIAGCSNAPAVSTAPSSVPNANLDLAGTWNQSDGSRMWTLTMGSAVQVGGPATFVQHGNPVFGDISGAGYVVGVIVLNTLRFSEIYERLSPELAGKDCYIDVEGVLTLGNGVMNGSYVQTESCAGVRMGERSGTLQMRR